MIAVGIIVVKNINKELLTLNDCNWCYRYDNINQSCCPFMMAVGIIVEKQRVVSLY